MKHIKLFEGWEQSEMEFPEPQDGMDNEMGMDQEMESPEEVESEEEMIMTDGEPQSYGEIKAKLTDLVMRNQTEDLTPTDIQKALQ